MLINLYTIDRHKKRAAIEKQLFFVTALGFKPKTF